MSVYGTDTRMAPRGTFLGSMIRTSWLAFRLVSLSRLGLDPLYSKEPHPYTLRPALPIAGRSVTSAYPSFNATQVVQEY